MVIDTTSLLAALVAVTVGTAVQSLTGFGMAVIAAPILVLINPDYLPAPILALGCVLSLLNCARYRHRMHFGNTRLALSGRVPGAALGIWLLALLPQSFFFLSFSLLIILSVILSYHHFSVSQSPRNLLIAGFFSGLMGTTTSVGGPPMALAYQNSELSTARAELGLFFLLGTLMSLCFLLLSGNFSHRQLLLTLPLLPAVLAGFWLSLKLDKRFQAHYLKPLIALLSLSASAVILIKAIRAI